MPTRICICTARAHNNLRTTMITLHQWRRYVWGTGASVPLIFHINFSWTFFPDFYLLIVSRGAKRSTALYLWRIRETEADHATPGRPGKTANRRTRQVKTSASRHWRKKNGLPYVLYTVIGRLMSKVKGLSYLKRFQQTAVVL